MTKEGTIKFQFHHPQGKDFCVRVSYVKILNDLMI